MSPSWVLPHLVWILASVLAAGPSTASDGVLEIKQSCATQTGCFPFDAPGFPVEITQPGSCRLTGNLATLSKDATAILISAHDVQVDLDGFTIACPFSIIEPPGCGASMGSGKGLASDVAAHKRATSHSGTIRDMGSHGIHLRFGASAVIEDLRIEDNGGSGIVLGDPTIPFPSEFAIEGQGAVLRGNSIVSNGRNGVYAPVASLIVEDVIERNDATGLLSIGPFQTIYRDNVIQSQSDNVSGSLVDRGGNDCGPSPCP